MSALSLTGVRVQRGRREVLRIPALDLAEGETLTVIGPNGAGKSTLLLTAALLLDPTHGEIRILGESAARGRHRVRQRRLTATVFQEPALLDMPVRRNLETALALHNVHRSERRVRAEDWLTRLGVAHLSDAMPHTLSGGEAQRVALARAFSVRPRLLFLDEPFSSLDPGTRSELVGELRTLLAAEATTALFVTHDLSEAQLLANHVALLIEGDLAQYGAVETVFEAPSRPDIASFLGYSLAERALLPASAVASASLPPTVSTVGVRPGAVRLVSDDVRGEVPEALDAVVTSVQGAHGRGRLILEVGGARLASELPIETLRRIAVGQSVKVTIDPAGLTGW